MKKQPATRPASNLSEYLYQRIDAYAIAAVAAGMGALASGQPAHAKIVYTPAHVHINGGQPPVPLDLNRDGFIDFYFLHSYSHYKNIHELEACQSVSVYDGSSFCRVKVGSNQIRATGTDREFEAAVRYGQKIQAGNRFVLNTPLGGERDYCRKSSTTYWFGPWMDGGKGVKNRYLGLKFKIKGKFHFGWARLTVETTQCNFTATLTGYAYETIPGKGIIAGQTKGSASPASDASLGALAAGARGLALRRESH